MAFRVFLTDYPRGRMIASQEAEEMSADRILDEFDHLSDTRGCFLGVISDSGRTVQCIWEDDARLTLDIPIRERQGSLRKMVNYTECRSAISRFLTQSNIENTPGLVFSSWR